MTDSPLTVRAMLQFPEILAAQPEVLSADPPLDRTVRWVFVSGVPRAVEFMRGGEVLLTNAAGWPTDVAGLEHLADTIAARQAAGVFVEVTARNPTIHPAFIAAIEHRGIPLVRIRGRVDTVAVTERAHRRILVDQAAVLTARERVSELITVLAKRAVSAEQLVEHLGRILGRLVVLEDSAHRIIAIGGGDWDSEHLREWPPRTQRAGEPPWISVSIEGRGQRWGSLVVFPGAEKAGAEWSSIERVIVEQGAVALALERLIAPVGDRWVDRASALLLEQLLGGRFVSTDLIERRLWALGLPRESALAGAVLRNGPHLTAAVLEAAAAELGGSVLAAPGVEPEDWILVLALPTGPSAEEFARGLHGRLPVADEPPTQQSTRSPLLVVGREARGVSAVLESLTSARRYLDEGGEQHSGVVVVAGDPLNAMLASLLQEPSARESAEALLAPVEQHDAEHGTDLFGTLVATVRHPLSRSRAAQRAGLSRSAYYARLAQLAEVLAAGEPALSLDDEDTVVALSVAVRLRRATP